MRKKSFAAMTIPLDENGLDVSLLSEILREFTPYRVMRAHQTATTDCLLADELPHSSWYYDAWVISTAYRLLQSGGNQASIERALLELIHPENPDENR